MASSAIGRRQFLRQGACAALGTTGLLATLSNLRLLGAALAGDIAAAPAVGDYKALVCVFLYGGNDANNLLIPTDAETFRLYTQARAELALPTDGLVGITANDGRPFGIPKSAEPLADLFKRGRLSFLANVGTLVAPVTRKDYLRGSAALPYQLFSHADQALQWQTSRPDNALEPTGWGGRVADLLQAMNENSQVSFSISLGGMNTFQVGTTTSQLQLSDEGPVSINAIQAEWAEATRKKVLSGLLQLERENLLQERYVDVNRRSIDNYTRLRGALDGVPEPTGFADEDLARQLKLIARMIKAGPGLGVRRQIFFASKGGWDSHDQQLTSHAKNLTELSAALNAFQTTLDGYGVAEQVTTFTASDFGRTLASNGKGSDHGWGSHHLVMGGAVTPQAVAGTFPDLVIDGRDDTGHGRWIPTTAVDQYAGMLARWMGVTSSSLPGILPNIGRFNGTDLGVLRGATLAG
ncbi:DUF1501 domain-containing protein [Nibricoccus sp. IMCC34717]|uniref:DUF1501 domain-containing protein n=1 Tax=Nibricoccus sp. IMCC34717 TaxID=3034021 RepID=UPI00384F1087